MIKVLKLIHTVMMDLISLKSQFYFGLIVEINELKWNGS